MKTKTPAELGGNRFRVLGMAAATALATAAVVYAIAGGALGTTLAHGLSGLGAASPKWLWVAAAGFACSLLATAEAWREAINACGGRQGHADAWARYGVGSILNAFLPARLGDVARVGLFSQALPRDSDGQALTAIGALGAVSVTEALTQAPVVGLAAVLGVVPPWSLGVALGVAAAAGTVAFGLRKRVPANRTRHVLDVYRSLVSRPRRTARLLLWAGAATASRVFAAAAIAAAVGVPNPLVAGLVISAALSLATAVPVMPGNLGVTSGAVVLALHARGVALHPSIATGIAFHAVETAAGIAAGAAGTVYVVRYRSPRVRRWSLRAAGASAALLLAAAFGATAVPSLA